ncbi:UNVERIFIED_CONTAM: hypothetical protein RMT77_006648 [Armadillidium vulgare]
MSNRNIHVNPNFYSQSHPNIHINPSFVKKVDNFSERGIDVDINEESLNIGHNLVPNINTKPSKSSTYNLRTNQSLHINKNKPSVCDTYKFVRNSDGVPLTLPYNQSTILSSTSNYSLNKGNSSHTVSQNAGTVSRYTFLNSKQYKSSRISSTKSPLKNNSHKYLSPSAKSSFSVNHNLRFPEISHRNIYENEGAEKNSLSHSIGVNTKMNSKNFNHRSDPFTICNNLVPQSANNNNDDSYGANIDVKNVNSKNFSYSFSNQNILRTDNDILCKHSNLKSIESKKDSELLQSCIYSPPTIFKSRLKLIRRDTIRKSAKYIREDLLAKKRKYAVKTKTKLVRRNSTNYKCQKSIAPKLSKLRRSLTLRKGSLLRAKERVVFNHVSKPRASLFSKQNKFFRNGSIISNFKIRKSQHSKSKYSSPPSDKYAWSLASKRGHVKILSDKFININGNLYKSTATSLKKQDLSPKPKKKHRLISSKYFSRKILNLPKNSKLVYRRQSSNTKLESGTLIEIVRRKKLAHFKRVNDFCFFYNKYGKCKKENKGCPFIHDPSRIAICTRFLQGTCSNTDCPFSHKLDKNKMPACSHFLEGLCSREECPYRHVRVNPGAPVCVDFLKGHCPQGEECKNKHILICEDFILSGSCPRGNKCPLSHRKPPSDETSRKPKKNLNDCEKSKKNRTCKMGVLGLATGDENKGYKPHSSVNRYFDDCLDSEDVDEREEGSTSISNSSTLDVKRKRIFQKLEKIKRNYNVGVDSSRNYLDSQPNKEQERLTDETKSEVSTEIPSETLNSGSDFRYAPSCKVLPSYIPLEMSECPESVQ